MEQNPYNDEFEKMLRESTDDFRMYPSRKVWHSIYNDLHPDRRWPSLAVCLVLLTAILHIGVSNNNSLSKKNPNLFNPSLSAKPMDGLKKSGLQNTNKLNPFKIKLTSDLKNSNIRYNKKQHAKTDILIIATEEKSNHFRELKDHSKKNYQSKFLSSLEAFASDDNEMEKDKLFYMSEFQSLNKLNLPIEKLVFNLSEKKQNMFLDEAKLIDGLKPDLPVRMAMDSKENDFANHEKNGTGNTDSNLFVLSNKDRAWIDNYAFYNKKNKEKWKAKFSIQYYITPSVGYRELYKNVNFEPSVGLLVRAANSDNDITQLAAANIEGGATLLLKMNKRLRFKTGVQINLTNYITYAHKLEHPTQTTILLNSDNDIISPVAYSTSYGNVQGSNLDHLNNKTVQISVPIGADFKLLGKDKLKWYVGATIQPTRVLSGDAYLISADVKNFAYDASMIRKWNLNSSVETFISYKTPSGLNINLGPQLRYQLISTYNKQYTYSEKLYNIGLKIGLSSNF